MNSLVAAVLLSVLSAIGYALAAIAQERAAAARSRRGFLLAVALNAAGAILHVIALQYGSLAVVQPLGALTLVLALPLGAAIDGRRTTRREWRGAFAILLGLGVLLAALDTGAPSHALTDAQSAGLIAATLVLIGALAVPYPRKDLGFGLRLAVASGVAFAVASVLTQTLMLRPGPTPVALLLLTGVGVFGLGGLVLSQAAYRYGLGGPLAVLTIANPLTAAAIGMLLLDEAAGLTFADGAAGTAAGIVAAAGVVLLVAPRRSNLKVIPAMVD